MRFSGELTPEFEAEFRDLYYKRNPLFKIVWAVIGVALIALAIFIFVRMQWSGSIVVLLIGIAFFISAFTLPQISWHWWWKEFLSIFGRQLSFEVQPTGLQLKPDIPVVEWKRFIATKETDSLILLYWTKTAAYPIYRRMASSEADWAELTNLIKKNIYRRAW